MALIWNGRFWVPETLEFKNQIYNKENGIPFLTRSKKDNRNKQLEEKKKGNKK